MKSAVIYSFDANAKFKTIDSVFTKFDLEMTEVQNPDSKGLLYVDTAMDQDLSKFLGYGLKHKIKNDDIPATVANEETKHLQDIRKVLSKPNYDKLIEAFNKKLTLMKGELKTVEKDAGHQTAGQLNNAVTNYNDLVGKVNTFLDGVATNDGVLAVKNKIDKFIQKKQALYDSQLYTFRDEKERFNVTNSINVNSQTSKGNNIDTAISSTIANSNKLIEDSFNQFKSMVSALLEGCTSFELILVTDGAYNKNFSTERNIIANKLTLEDLVYLKNREKLVFFAK